MTPRWTDSTGKHGVSRADAINAILNATYVVDIRANGDGTVDRLFIGPQHAQTARELEVIVNMAVDGTGREVVVFHVMELGPMFRRMREENPNGV
jgi:hypothetical protein